MEDHREVIRQTASLVAALVSINVVALRRLNPEDPRALLRELGQIYAAGWETQP